MAFGGSAVGVAERETVLFRPPSGDDLDNGKAQRLRGLVIDLDQRVN